ncbi:MAG: ribosome recycling factor [Aggregatilineales bacterium]
MNEIVREILSEVEDKMKSTLSVFEDDLNGIRGNRASPALVDRLMVEYYGQDTELRQLANISTPEPMLLMIRPFDGSAVKAIEKAIQEANLGMNPNTDGTVIRLNMPALTRERRQELVKVLGKRTEDARISIRNIRRSGNDDAKSWEKEKEISEDESKGALDSIQKLTDNYIGKIDAASKEKEVDILEV